MISSDIANLIGYGGMAIIGLALNGMMLYFIIDSYKRRKKFEAEFKASH